MPSTIVAPNAGPYTGMSSVIYGTVFTDPYGGVYQSPTPIWKYEAVQYATYSASLTDGTYTCVATPTERPSSVGYMNVLPSGFWMAADNSNNNGLGNPGELHLDQIPVELRQYVAAHSGLDPRDPKSSNYNVSGCGLGIGAGSKQFPSISCVFSESIQNQLETH